MPTPTIPAPTSSTMFDPAAMGPAMAMGLHGFGLRREVLEQSSLAIVEVDMQRRILYANPTALRLLGAPANYFGISLDQVFVDQKSKKLVDKEIEP